MKTEELTQIKKSAKDKYSILKRYGKTPRGIYFEYGEKLRKHRQYFQEKSDSFDSIKTQNWEKEFLAISTIINLASNEL